MATAAAAAVIRRSAPAARVRVLAPARLYATASPTPRQDPPTPPPTQPTELASHKSPLTPFLRRNRWAMALFLGVTRALGYASPKQLAARRALALYEDLCACRADDEMQFWMEECHLPPTFQSWFTITNLHIVLTRIRALPKSQAEAHTQGLLDHFFLDVEDRVRGVLQPRSFDPDRKRGRRHDDPMDPLSMETATDVPTASPPTPPDAHLRITKFYSDPRRKTPEEREGLGDAPERLVSQQMKILREQWAGLAMAFDVALLKGDAEMAGAIWRNMLGARGARGIDFGGEEGETAQPRKSASPINVASTMLTTTPSAETSNTHYRRSINLVGGSTTAVRLVDNTPGGLDAAEGRDDGSGVYDFGPSEVDKYVRYPETMAALVGYVRREVKRLEGMSDEEVLGEVIVKEGRVLGRKVGSVEEKVKFGSVRT